jgi:small subunit ribosomal protein S10
MLRLSIITKFKIYLHIKSFFHYYLKRDLNDFLFFLKKNQFNLLSSKIIYLPTTVKKFSVVRSPFVSKLSKEQFEIRIYKILVIFYTDDVLFMNFFSNKNIINFDFSYYKLRHFCISCLKYK